MVSGKIDRFSTPVTHMPRALRSRSDGSTEGRTTAEGTTPPSHGKRATARQAASGVQRAVGRWRQGRCARARGAVGSWRARNVPARRRRLGESPPIPRRSDGGLRIPASNGCSQARPWVLIALARSDWAMPRVRILDRQLRRRAAGDRPARGEAVADAEIGRSSVRAAAQRSAVRRSRPQCGRGVSNLTGVSRGCRGAVPSTAP